MRCSAVLLAGGQSSRMGRDKAFLEIDGQPLWRRQIAILRQLAPEQLMISGPARKVWTEFEIVADETAGAGPLAGVAAALKKCATPRLVVLAVDLPEVTAEFLRSLLELSTDRRGVVPAAANGYEPLAAVYPVACASLAAAALREGDFSMQRFVRRAQELDRIVERTLSDAEQRLLANLNTPADL